MKKETKRYMKILRFLSLMVIIAFGFITIVGTGGGGGDGGSSTTPGTGGDTIPQTITPGTWTGPADFGESSFIVDSTSTGITEITFTFNNFNCGSVTRDGSIIVSAGTPWPVVDRQFTIENTFDTDFEMTLIGTFDNTGTNVSGTYEAVASSTTCSGIWDATHSISCADIAGDWEGTYSENYCGGGVFNGNHSATFRNDCSVTVGVESLGNFEGTFTLSGQTVIITLPDLDAQCGTYILTGTVNGNQITGTISSTGGSSGTFNFNKVN